MQKDQIFNLLVESLNENQCSYLDLSPLEKLGEDDAGDVHFILSLVEQFLVSPC